MNTQRIAALLLGLFILLVPFHAESWGADWRQFAVTNDDSVYYYDTESIRQVSKDTLRIWQKWDYSPKEVEGYVKKFGEEYLGLEHSIILQEIDCLERKFKVLSVTDYRSDDSIIQSLGEEGFEWRYIAPESVAEGLLKAVCKGRQ